MFISTRIRKRIMDAIAPRIKDAEQRYEEVCSEVDNQYQEDAARLFEGAKSRKEQEAIRLVSWVIEGKE